MPRDGDPRFMVRLSPESAAAIEESARGANVAVAALIRECAERHHAAVAREVASGNLRLRRARVEVAEAAAPVVRARSLVVGDGAALALERQRKLNEAAERARAKPAARRPS